MYDSDTLINECYNDKRVTQITDEHPSLDLHTTERRVQATHSMITRIKYGGFNEKELEKFTIK